MNEELIGSRCIELNPNPPCSLPESRALGTDGDNEEEEGVRSGDYDLVEENMVDAVWTHVS